MTNPWLITVLGMGTVFLALIIMALVLKLFPLMFGIKLPGKESAALPAARAKEAQLNAPRIFAQPVPDSTAIPAEVVAAICAAISAARGPDSGTYRIASVTYAQNNGSFNTPAWGHIDRLVR